MAAVTRLAIMRHASAHPHAATDWDRPLSEHGLSQAVAAGQWLVAMGFHPATSIVSSSVRTRQTATALGLARETAASDEAYNASAETLAELVRECAAGPVLVVAHNPGVSMLAHACGCRGVMAPGSVVIVSWDGSPADLGLAPVTCEGRFAPP